MSELAKIHSLLKLGRVEIGQMMADLAKLNASIGTVEIQVANAREEIAAAESAYRALLRQDLSPLMLEQLSLIRDSIAYSEKRQVELRAELAGLRERAKVLKGSIQRRDGKCKKYEERIGQLRKDTERRHERRFDRIGEEHFLTKWAAHESG